MMSTNSRLLLASTGIACALMAGCSSAPLTLPNDDYERTVRLTAFRQKHADPYDLVYVPSRGGASNSITLGALRSGAGTGNSRALGEMLRNAQGRKACLVVTSPDNELGAETLLDALGRLEGKRLDGVQVGYIGSPAYEEKLRKATTGAGGIFLFAQYP